MKGADERGDSLIEVLLAVAIIGVGVTGILGALGTGVSLSSLQQARATSETLVREYAETIRSTAFQGCTTGDPEATYWTVKPITTAATVNPPVVEHWDRDSGGFVTACPTVDVLQRVTVTVESNDSRIGPLTIQFAKREPTGGSTP